MVKSSYISFFTINKNFTFFSSMLGLMSRPFFNTIHGLILRGFGVDGRKSEIPINFQNVGNFENFVVG